MDLANWVLWTSPKFTTGVKYQFHKVSDQISDPEIPVTLRPLTETRLAQNIVPCLQSPVYKVFILNQFQVAAAENDLIY